MKAAHTKTPADGGIPPVLVPPSDRNQFGKKAPADGNGQKRREFERTGYNLLERLREDEKKLAANPPDEKKEEARFYRHIKNVENLEIEMEKGRKERNKPASVAKCMSLAAGWDKKDRGQKLAVLEGLAQSGGPASYQFLMERIGTETSLSVQLGMLDAIKEIADHYPGHETISAGFKPLLGFIRAKLHSATAAGKEIREGTKCYRILEHAIRAGISIGLAEAYNKYRELLDTYEGSQPHVAVLLSGARIDHLMG